MPKPRPPTINDVRSYWDAAPLLSHEAGNPGSPEFFAVLDKAKRTDSERFAMGYWRFDGYRNRRVLDIGCGPGWLAVQYAKGGANVWAVDLTPRAVGLARRHLELAGVAASICEANAEDLPFPDNAFDLVVASGVLHHTPDMERAFRESCRVTRPGGEGKITLYRKGILHARAMFALTALVMRVLGVHHPGADLAADAQDADDFIRQYDGRDNPVGVGRGDSQWAAALTAAGWIVASREVHYFPLRFVPRGTRAPVLFHRFLDRWFGTMVYFRLRKP